MLSSEFRDEIAQLIAILHSAYRTEGSKELPEILDRVQSSVSRLRALEIPHRSAFSGEQLAPGIVTTSDSPPLHSVVADHVRRSTRVSIASAFLSAGDTNPLILPLQDLTSDGGTVRILTSLMGFLNRPETLTTFANWEKGLSLRLYCENADRGGDLLAEQPPAFHAKAILCEKEDGRHVMLIGSSNFTAAGFGPNVEWNYLSDFEINAPLVEAKTPFERALELFDTAWNQHGYAPSASFIEKYGQLHRRADEARQTLSLIIQSGGGKDRSPAQGPGLPSVIPRPAQQEALKRLEALRKAGVPRFAVIAATGLGKTYLSAFEARSAGATRILFIAHRDLILRQAEKAYGKVLTEHARVLVQGKKKVGAVPDGNVAVFASIQTLAREANLKRFAPDSFDYVIIDEFHHAQAESYQKVLTYLKPTHLLGMTATPERADGQDVLELCDRRIAYEVRLLEAISRRWLAPFHYYAIYDPVDYEPIRWTGTGYDEAELEQALSNDSRAELITRNLRRFQPSHGKTKALAFCSNVGHARWMAEAFSKRGVVSVALLGDTLAKDRAAILDRLQDETDPLEAVCAVDVLNEGIDVPSLTHVLMLRPTQSFTLFLQPTFKGCRGLVNAFQIDN